jgi:PAS domain S-box-containing protein
VFFYQLWGCCRFETQERRFHFAMSDLLLSLLSDADVPDVSAEGLKTLLALSPDALLLVDQVGTIVAANAQATVLFGYPSDELIDQRLEFLLPARFHAAHQAHRERYLAAPHIRPMGKGLELLGKRADGTEFPVDISLRPLRLTGSLHVIAAVRDVTEQRAAERERILAAERQHVLADVLRWTHDAILLRDPVHRIISWNRAAERLYGWSEREALGRISHVLLKTRFPLTRSALEDALEREGQWSGELIHTCRDGHTISVASHQVLLRDEQGHPTVILEMNHQISPQRREQAAVQAVTAAASAQLTFFRAVVDMLPSSIYVVRGQQARLVLANQAADDLWGAHWQTGQTMQEFIQQQKIAIFDLQGRAGPPESWATLRAVAGNEAVHYHQEIIRQPTGKQIPVLVHAIPLREHWQGLWTEEESIPLEQQDRLALVIHQDVTPLKEAEYLKDEFIGVAAHELRTPLAVLKSASSMLRVQTARGHGPALADWQHEALQEIEVATARLVDLAEDLLDVTRLQAGRLQLHVQEENLVTVVHRAVTQLQATTVRHQLKLHVPPAPLLVKMDAGRIEQVLANLLNNAIKYSPRGGPVVVILWEEHARGEARLSVQDEGMGIPLHQHAQIGSRFMRADNAHAAGITGSGLGLYLCRELMALHEGRLWFQSTEGQGSTFFLALPLTSVSQTA